MAAPRDRGATQAVPRPHRQFFAQCAWTRHRQHLSAKRWRLALRRLMVSGNAMHKGVGKRASKPLTCRPRSSERAAHLKKAATTCLLAACASPKLDGLRERLQMTTRCQPIAGSQSTASRRFIQACAKAFFVKVCASVCTITPCSLRRICAVYAVDPSSRFLADMVPMVPSTTSIIRSTDCSPDHGKSGFSGVFQGATHGATDSQKCQ